MIRSRIAPPLLLAAMALVLAMGCSTRKGKILGNERLLRGSGGFGTTVRETILPDRDATVSSGYANFGPTLVLGTAPGFEGRAFFNVPAWNIPDTSDVSVVVQDIYLEFPFDPLAVNNTNGLFVTLATTATPYDTLAAWPGPAPGLTLGTVDAANVIPLRIPISITAYSLIKGWAADPSSLPGLMLYPSGGSGLIGLEAGKGTIKIGYSHDVAGATQVDTLATALPIDFYLHPLPAPAPTAGDSVLVLGGLFEFGVPLRFPAMSVAEGATVNEATIRLHVDTGDSLRFAEGQKTRLVVRRLRSSWLESVTDTTGLLIDTAITAVSDTVAVKSAADSVLTITLPQSIVREWTVAGAINDGILITMTDANRLKEIRFGSRESSMPAELRVSITTPPPGRF